jgi:Spy/CpxP family protein refolding chaperone
MRTKIVTVAAAVLLLAVGVVALTGFGGGFCPLQRHGHGRDPAAAAAAVTARVEDTLDDLDATPEQRARILAVKDRLLDAAKGLHGDRAETHDALVTAWKAESPDAADLHALVDARAAELKAFADELVDAAIEVHGVLTPEQRERLTRKVERWHR